MTYKRGEVKTRELRQLVATRRQAFEQQQKRVREEQQRKAAIEQKKAEEARKAEEERERQRIDAEVKARQEERLRRIKQEQQEARKKVAMESMMVSVQRKTLFALFTGSREGYNVHLYMQLIVYTQSYACIMLLIISH